MFKNIVIVVGQVRGTTLQSYRRWRGTRYDSPKLIVSEVKLSEVKVKVKVK